MAETLIIDHSLDKAARYAALYPQLEALIQPEEDLTANLANLMAALKYSMDFFWVGCYRVMGETLVLGPFQGPVACTRIPFGQGVCGSAWQQRTTLVVPDVEQFPGHIACSSEARSEIVVPVQDASGTVRMVLDVDSSRLNDFDDTDQQWLERIAQLIGNLLS
ncbi:MAG: GAF domain-containing protein [Bacteroidota bacterium]